MIVISVILGKERGQASLEVEINVLSFYLYRSSRRKIPKIANLSSACLLLYKRWSQSRTTPAFSGKMGIIFEVFLGNDSAIGDFEYPLAERRSRLREGSVSKV